MKATRDRRRPRGRSGAVSGNTQPTTFAGERTRSTNIECCQGAIEAMAVMVDLAAAGDERHLRPDALGMVAMGIRMVAERLGRLVDQGGML